jgi:dTDP-4-amino-4,6-dideoxygalactose transaminase
MITTMDEAVAERIRIMRSHGMTTLTWDRHKGHAHSYNVVDLGYNYRINEMASALGRAQLKKLDFNFTNSVFPLSAARILLGI